MLYQIQPRSVQPDPPLNAESQCLRDARRHPNWRTRLLQWPRHDVCRAEFIVATAKGEVVILLPDTKQDLKAFAGPSNRLHVGYAKSIVFIQRGAARKADFQPAIDEMIGHADFLGERQWVMKGHHDDAGSPLHATRDTRQIDDVQQRIRCTVVVGEMVLGKPSFIPSFRNGDGGCEHAGL